MKYFFNFDIFLLIIVFYCGIKCLGLAISRLFAILSDFCCVCVVELWHIDRCGDVTSQWSVQLHHLTIIIPVPVFLRRYFRKQSSKYAYTQLWSENYSPQFVIEHFQQQLNSVRFWMVTWWQTAQSYFIVVSTIVLFSLQYFQNYRNLRSLFP